MKANELSCKDLMVGDWVFIKDYPIKASPQKVKPEHFVRSLVEFEPIPLTQEILENNGWKYEFDKTDYMVKYDLGEEGKNCWMMWAMKEHNLDIQRQNENLDMYNLKVSKVVIPCDYVHQLQHALRLCGIEKEIVV